MPMSLDELATSQTCAIYNDLSHINPRYLTPQKYEPTFHDEEVLYHKKNLLLLSLYFDKIIICTDNILAFTRFLSKDIVSSVVMSRWFAELVEQGVIVLAGWGSSISSNMMKNQVEYSGLYRPELKEKRYIECLFELSDIATWVVREPGPGEREHINYLRPLVQSSEGPFDLGDIRFLSDLIEETNHTTGYVGTMEMFPFVDELYSAYAEKLNSFYNSYYTSWHAYCAAHYAPAIPIHTSKPDRIRAVLIETISTSWADELRQAANHFAVSGPKPLPLFWFTTSELFTKPVEISEGNRTRQVPLYLTRPEIIFELIWATPVDDTLHSILN